MKRSVWIVASLVVLAGLVLWLVVRPGSEHTVVDLVAELPNTVVTIPNREAFSVAETTIAGDTKQAIVFKGNSRLAWRVTVPENAWLTLSLGVTEDAWNITGGDGVWFRVTVYDEELLSITLDAQKNTADRQWKDYLIDLSEYAGETVDVYLKTNAGAPGSTNVIGDHSAWGAPRIITR